MWKSLLQWERRESSKVEEKIFWLRVEVELGEQEGKVEVGAWRHDLNVPDSCHILLVKRRRKCNERWGK